MFFLVVYFGDLLLCMFLTAVAIFFSSLGLTRVFMMRCFVMFIVFGFVFMFCCVNSDVVICVMFIFNDIVFLIC